jgi:carbon starvation protein
VSILPLANLFFEFDEVHGRTMLRAMPIMLGALCILAVAYRYYSAFLAAKVAALDDSRQTPAYRFNDGQNYHPTNKWVLFGHHFAAISGAGPLIGPVLAIQYGYFPGLLWLVIGVTLAGAVQDMLVLAASVRHNGRSLAQIALTELGRPASIVVSAAILFIVIIALAGLSFVVVKAVGGDEAKFPPKTRITLPAGQELTAEGEASPPVYLVPAGSSVQTPSDAEPRVRPEAFRIQAPGADPLTAENGVVRLPAGGSQLIPGSSWGVFTVACTIPIALFVGLYMYRIRPGKVVEASVIGGVAVLAAVIAGDYVRQSPLGEFFTLTREQTIIALAAYGFIASVLPVWLLLGPRDYLSSFLKIGTIALLVLGVLLANPVLIAPPLNKPMAGGGPTFQGAIFPFVFICIMCGAISGFHSLVSSGTTPKMIEKESQVRPIGYGAMLIEGLVGVVALLAAASLPVDLYYDINVGLDKADNPTIQQQLREVDDLYGRDPMHAVNVGSFQHLNLADAEQKVSGEPLRGRTGGAVTLAVGMSIVLSDALQWTGLHLEPYLKYWYHFAIMFEVLFILTTIDAGTRIARFLVQEAMGKVKPEWGRTNWLPGACLASALVSAGWAALVWSGSISTIWPMFGIANQLLAVLALALVTTWLFNTGRGRYTPFTILPMLFVTATTMTAGSQMVGGQFPAMIKQGKEVQGWLNIALALFVMVSVGTLLVMAVSRWLGIAGGLLRTRDGAPSPTGEGGE